MIKSKMEISRIVFVLSLSTPPFFALPTLFYLVEKCCFSPLFFFVTSGGRGERVGVVRPIRRLFNRSLGPPPVSFRAPYVCADSIYSNMS